MTELETIIRHDVPASSNHLNSLIETVHGSPWGTMPLGRAIATTDAKPSGDEWHHCIDGFVAQARRQRLNIANFDDKIKPTDEAQRKLRQIGGVVPDGRLEESLSKPFDGV